jgi:hypothetical protein
MYTAITRGESERDMTDKRGLNPRKKNRANNTESPRTRDGQTYPGGKVLRRALARLARRKGAVKSGQRIPGSMVR